MRSKDKTLLADIEKFVSNYTDRFGISPTMQEVADGVGSSKATVQRYITQLCEDGVLNFSGYNRHNRSPSAEVMKSEADHKQAIR